MDYGNPVVMEPGMSGELAIQYLPWLANATAKGKMPLCYRPIANVEPYWAWPSATPSAPPSSSRCLAPSPV